MTARTKDATIERMTNALQGQTGIAGPMLSIGHPAMDDWQLPEHWLATNSEREIPLDAGWIWGLLRPFTPRARAALLRLTQGSTEREASLAAGVSTFTINKWKHDSPEFMEAVAQCREAGIGLYEGELNRRALAGKEDPGSANLLKLKLQSVDEAYRDKRTLEVNNFNIHSPEALGGVLGAWQGRRVIEGKATDVVEHPNPSLTEGVSAPADGDESTPPQGTGGG